MRNRILRGGSYPIVVYDLLDKKVVDEITDYALYLADKVALNEKTISSKINNIVRFANYVSNMPNRSRKVRPFASRLSEVCDADLIRFRDDDLIAVSENSRSYLDPRRARATVNARLASIYHWFWWLLSTSRIETYVVGPGNCSIEVRERTTLNQGRMRGRSTRRTLPYLEMPLLFKEVHRSGRHDTGFVPSREIADEVVARIMSRQSSDFRNTRDALIVDLAVEVGLRVGSIASLMTSDFKQKEIEISMEDSILVTPSVQKFSYQNSFYVPLWLAVRVCNFIEERDKHLRMRGFDVRKATKYIFIAERSCLALTSRSVSQTIGRELRSLGAPKGTSIHAFRALFCTEEIEQEIDERLKLGLDTSTASVSAAVALKMGHRDPMSLFPYVSRSFSRRGAKARASRESIPRN